MYKIALTQPTERIYANNGQHAEYVARYTLTGSTSWADNIPAHVKADVLNIQIKSARATVCRMLGYDKKLELRLHLMNDKAKRYGYVTKDFATMYIMDKFDYCEFALKFGTLDRESTGVRGAKHVTNAGTTGGQGGSNGGHFKLRLKHESQAMLIWLEERTR